jgi:uncharacterized membrane protein YbaN (DUF454 family)
LEEINLNKLLVIPSVLFFILGIIGLIIPVIPQIPFFAVSVLLLAAASTRFKKFIVSTEIYKKHFQKYVDKNEKLSKFMNDF